jgi:integrase
VPVPAFLARLLETEIDGCDRGALVSPSARGSDYVTLGQARYAFQKATAAVEGCDRARLHDLRDTCASPAIRSGANVKVLQKLLGDMYPDDLRPSRPLLTPPLRLLRTLCGRSRR